MRMVNVIYDPAIFYTDDEYLNMFSEKVKVKERLKNQSCISWPGVQQMTVNLCTAIPQWRI